MSALLAQSIRALLPQDFELLSDDLLLEFVQDPFRYTATSSALITLLAAYAFPSQYSLPGLSGGVTALVAGVSVPALEGWLQHLKYGSPARAVTQRLLTREPADSTWAVGAGAAQRERLGVVPVELFNGAYDSILEALDSGMSGRAALRAQLWGVSALPSSPSFDQVLEQALNNLYGALADDGRQASLLSNTLGRRLLDLALLQLQRARAVVASGEEPAHALQLTSTELATTTAAATPGLATLLAVDRREALNFTRSVVLQMFVDSLAVLGDRPLPDALRSVEATASDLVVAAVQLELAATAELQAALCWLSENQLWSRLYARDPSIDARLPHTSSRLPRATLTKIFAATDGWARDNADALRCVRILHLLKDNPDMAFTTLPVSQFFVATRQLEALRLSKANDSLVVNFNADVTPEYIVSLVQGLTGQLDNSSNTVITESLLPSFTRWLESSEYYTQVLVNLPADTVDRVNSGLRYWWLEMLASWKLQLGLASVVTVLGVVALRNPLATLRIVWRGVVTVATLVRVLRPPARTAQAALEAFRSIRADLVAAAWTAVRESLGAALDKWWASGDDAAVRGVMARMVDTVAGWAWLSVLARPMCSDHRVVAGSVLQRAAYAARARFDRDTVVPEPLTRLLEFMDYADKKANSEGVDVDSYLERLVFLKVNPLSLLNQKGVEGDSVFALLLLLLLDPRG
jgi:hypothetical protein